MFANSLTPLFLFLFNYVFIPTVVDNISYLEEYETKSKRHQRNLAKQFFFIILNTLFLPVTGLVSIRKFFFYVSDEEQIDRFALNVFSENILNYSDLFLRYLI